MSLAALREKAAKQGWHDKIITAADENAVLQGCYYSHRAADRICDFFQEVLHFSKGELAGQPVTLMDWQRDLLGSWWGWLKPNGLRRHTSASIWLPKKQSKSFLCSGCVLYSLIADGEMGAEVYSLAASMRNADIIARETMNMVRGNPHLDSELGGILEVIPSTRRIIYADTNSFYQVLPSKAESVEGFNISACYFDELHTQKKSNLFAALRFGGSARSQPMCPVSISTAGIFDPNSLAWQQWIAAKEIIDGVNAENISCFPYIRAATDTDDWTSEEVWRRVCPALGVFNDLDTFRADFTEAVNGGPSQQDEFKRYRLNIWSNSRETWMDDIKWMACNKPVDQLTPAQKKQIKWTAGLDLASTIDVNCLCLYGEHEKEKYTIPFFWVCRGQADSTLKKHGINYFSWKEQGLVSITDGDMVDYNFIFADILKICSEYNVTKIAVDQWNATQLVTMLQDKGLPVMWFDQSIKNVTNPMKELERLVYGGLLRHGGNPVARWMMSCVKTRHDSNGNIAPDKKACSGRDHIDYCVALLMAMGVWTQPEPAKPGFCFG